MLPTARPVRRKVIRLHRAQHEFCHSKALYRALIGGRGCGKSWAVSYDLIRRARRDRLYMMVSPTYTILADTDLRAFCALARDLDVLGTRKLSPPEVVLTTGATILFRSADDPDRLRGTNLSGVTLNEASLMHRDAYDVCIASLREAGEQGWLSAGLTPKGLSHWSYEKWGQPQPDTEVFHANTSQNPFLPPGFAETLALQYSPQRQRQELGGEWVSMEGSEWPGSYFDSHIWPDTWPSQWLASALALDPALGEGERGRPPPASRPAEPGCFAAFCFVGLGHDRNLYVDAWMSQTWDAAQLVTLGIQLCRDLRPGGFSIETNGGQAFLAELYQQEARRLNVVLPIYGLWNVEDKEVRIRSKLNPFLAQSRFRFKKDSPGAKLLVNQCRDFPVGRYKDGIDALQQALVMLDHLLGAKTGGAQPRAMR